MGLACLFLQKCGAEWRQLPIAPLSWCKEPTQPSGIRANERVGEEEKEQRYVIYIYNYSTHCSLGACILPRSAVRSVTAKTRVCVLPGDVKQRRFLKLQWRFTRQSSSSSSPPPHQAERARPVLTTELLLKETRKTARSIIIRSCNVQEEG